MDMEIAVIIVVLLVQYMENVDKAVSKGFELGIQSKALF